MGKNSRFAFGAVIALLAMLTALIGFSPTADAQDGPMLEASGDDITVTETDEGMAFSVETAGSYDLTIDGSGWSIPIFVLPCAGAEGSLEAMAEGDATSLCDIGNLTPAAPDGDGNFSVDVSGFDIEGCGLVIAAGDAGGTEATAILISVADAEGCGGDDAEAAADDMDDAEEMDDAGDGPALSIAGDDVTVSDDGTSFTVEEAGTYDISITGTGFSVDVFVLPCAGAAGSLEAMAEGDATSLCDLGALTPGSPDDDGTFTVEISGAEVDGCGLVFAAGDAAQTEAAIALLGVANPGDDVECEVTEVASAGYGDDDELADTGVSSTETGIIAITVALAGGLIANEARKIARRS